METLVADQYFASIVMMNRLHSHPRFRQQEERMKSAYRLTEKVVIVKWQDNKSIVMLSLVCGAEPVYLLSSAGPNQTKNM